MQTKDNESGPCLAVTERTTLKRVAGRGSHDRATIHAILDEGLVCTVSFLLDGAPAAIPMAYCRVEDTLYLHGSTANRMMRALRDGSETCVTVTLLDGLVLARSAFHHSVNFRCVVLYASAREVSDPAEKLAALEATVNHVVPGRWPDVRPPNQEELLRTRACRHGHRDLGGRDPVEPGPTATGRRRGVGPQHRGAGLRQRLSPTDGRGYDRAGHEAPPERVNRVRPLDGGQRRLHCRARGRFDPFPCPASYSWRPF
jgi:nitroimidazol reductase NimA-like FMN-containing flavoprotein (pyridoxamine 5'-phosphate oxidase superfamily)